MRPRQLSVRTLLLGMLRLSSEGRPGHLVRVHEALLCLPEAEQRRLGVIVRLHGAEHRLTYRQVEYTYGLIARALSKERPDGAPSELLCEVIDRLLEASVVACAAPTGGCYAIDWSALEAWSRPPRRDGRCTDPEAASVYDAATNNLARGHCRLRGLAPIALFCATVFVARNLRIADSFAARQAQEARERERAKGLPARRRRGRRGQAGEPAGAANAPPPAA